MDFTYRWNLSDLEKVPKNNLKVFSCFSGAGGSSMGYKMAGYDVVGFNEIDVSMAKNYVLNLKTKHRFVCPIQLFKRKQDFPEELMDLDILDGSPPCSTFSMASVKGREFFGKRRAFAEGQQKQVLSDLFFDFIDLAKVLRPKIIVAENVKGMLFGKSVEYLKRIFKALKEIGYDPQLFLLDGSKMGLPQRRQRIFFVCRRKDLNLKELSLAFKEKPITIRKACGEFLDEKGYDGSHFVAFTYWEKCKIGKNLSSAHPKGHFFNYIKIDPDQICPTIPADCRKIFRWDTMHGFSKNQLCLLSSFPLDYQFKYKRVGYCVGMSVPPIMMYKISREIYKHWFEK